MRTKPLFLYAALIGGLVVSPIVAADSQTVGSFERTITKTVSYHYLLSLPTGYDAAVGRTWPVILFLHGSGERGTDPWLVAKHGPPKLIRGDMPASAPAPGAPLSPPETPEARQRREAAAKALKENFIVVSPQCPLGTWWDDDAVLALLDEILTKHKADMRRVYLTGNSMGGYSTWSVGLKNPQRFAAIVPICGGGQRGDVRRGAGSQKAAFLSLGVWAFHGAKDPTVLLEESERMVAELKKAGLTDVQLTVYPEVKHDSWTETYANPDLYAWLLKHARPAPAAK